MGWTGRRIAAVLSIATTLHLAACSTPSNTPKPAPLPKIQNETVILEYWRYRIGPPTEFRFQPILQGDVVASVGSQGRLALLDLKTGQPRWVTTIDPKVAGGIGLGGQLVAFGTLKGMLYAYDLSGKRLWNISLSSELIAPPVVSDKYVLVRTGDGRLSAYAAENGTAKWHFQPHEPELLLRNFAKPVVYEGMVYYGQAGGRLAALDLLEGRLVWEAPVAVPHGATELERIVDIVSPPVAWGQQICAVTYQGRISCFNIDNGNLIWSRPFSSYSGMTMDAERLYITDDQGYISALDRHTGHSLWKQKALFGRRPSGPTILDHRYIVLGDYEGVVHFLDAGDGHFVAQKKTDGSPISNAPQALSSTGQVLVQTQGGHLVLLGLGPKRVEAVEKTKETIQ